MRRVAHTDVAMWLVLRVVLLIAVSTSSALISFAKESPVQTESGEALETDFSSQQLEFFEKRVRPLLIERCYSCHSGTKSGGGLSLETMQGWRHGGESGPAIVPGKPDESLLIDAIEYRSIEMPPADAGGKLSSAEIDVLTRWVRMGAPDPRDGATLGGMRLEQAQSWWAFQSLLPVEPESDGSQIIDDWLQKGIQERDLAVAAPADKRTLIRRATYDLTGLPPTADEVDAFLADRSPQAFEKVVDRLLQSPQYGVHWGRHWLDVVRYADTAGENTDRPLPHAWRYRNWVFDAFQQDLPFDDFVRMQLAGDLFSGGEDDASRAEGIIATGYLAIARRFGHDIDQDMYLTYEDVIDNLGKNFLGLSLGCARCHDHKYDPISADDYYALYGIFQSTRFSFPGCEPKGQPRDLVPLIPADDVSALKQAYQEKRARFEQDTAALQTQSERLKAIAAESHHVLADSPVAEGQSVTLAAAAPEGLSDLHLRKGEVLQLTVLPNGNHGADTTRVEIDIRSDSLGKPLSWNPEEWIDRFVEDAPVLAQRGATWCLLDVTDGPRFLHERQQNIQGVSQLQGWSIGGTPSAVVNASTEPVEVWTTLPPRAFFLHPGPQRNVAIAWVCPEDGIYEVRGTVTDAHPAGLDGVSFRLEHFKSPELGPGLIELARRTFEAPPLAPASLEIPVAYAVAEAQPQDAAVHLRGDPEQLGDPVHRRWLSVFGATPVDRGAGSGRRQLADWVAEHPTTARVMVNRIWGWHFGRGLVASPNDFGARGESPTHPELLDWLAARLVAGDYRIKPLHRMIMMTAAYQRAAATRREPVDDGDPENRWLARFSRRRLTAEELRDSLLVAAGQLDRSFAQAHPFPAEETWAFTQHNPFHEIYPTNRRSAFLMVQRQRRHPFLALFDGADPNASTPVRETTIVPTQALYFINDPFFHDQARMLSQRVVGGSGDIAERLEQIYRISLQRSATDREQSRWRRFLDRFPGDESQAWEAVARVLLASNEFLHLD